MQDFDKTNRRESVQCYRRKDDLLPCVLTTLDENGTADIAVLGKPFAGRIAPFAKVKFGTAVGCWNSWEVMEQQLKIEKALESVLQ